MFAFFPRWRPTFFLPIINPSKSVDSPPLFCPLRGFTFPDFFAAWTLLFPRTLLSYKSSGFLYCSSAAKQNLEIKDKPVAWVFFRWNHNHAGQNKNRLSSCGPHVALWAAYKRVQNKWWWTLLVTKTGQWTFIPAQNERVFVSTAFHLQNPKFHH